METIKIDYPTNAAAAIRLVTYLRGWSVRRLASEMTPKANACHLSRIVNHRDAGTQEMLERVLQMMPESVVGK